MMNTREDALGRTGKVAIVAVVLVVLVIGAAFYYVELEKSGGIKSAKTPISGNLYPIQTIGDQLILQLNLTSPSNITELSGLEVQLSGGGISGVITLTLNSKPATVAGVSVYIYNSQVTVGGNIINPNGKQVGLKGIDYIQNHADLFLYISSSSGFTSWSGVQITFTDPSYTGTIVYTVPT